MKKSLLTILAIAILAGLAESTGIAVYRTLIDAVTDVSSSQNAVQAVLSLLLSTLGTLTMACNLLVFNSAVISQYVASGENNFACYG